MTEFIQGKFYKDDDTGEKLLFIKTVSGTISDTYMFYSYQQEGIQIYLNNTGISEWTEPRSQYINIYDYPSVTSMFSYTSHKSIEIAETTILNNKKPIARIKFTEGQFDD